MKRFLIYAVFALIALAGLSTSARCQSSEALAIPGTPVAKDISGAHERPDPNVVYKVVFDIHTAAPKIDEVNPDLVEIARYVNTLVKWGVPADHRKLVVVLHRGGTEMALQNAAFKARNDGHDNPNIALIQSLTKAGVQFRVCGQSVLAKKIAPDTLLPEVQLDLWARITLTHLQLRGYVHIAGS